MKNIFTIVIHYIASSIFPERTKRLILMSSLFSKLTKKNSLDRDTLRRINDTLKICEFDGAMLLPMKYSHTLWNGVVVDENEEPKSFDIQFFSIKKSIIDNVPKWLRYDTADMEKDITTVLIYCFNDMQVSLECTE